MPRRNFPGLTYDQVSYWDMLRLAPDDPYLATAEETQKAAYTAEFRPASWRPFSPHPSESPQE